MNWTKPEALEIKMDAEISSYQEDGPDPLRDGPLFVQNVRAPMAQPPAETER